MFILDVIKKNRKAMLAIANRYGALEVKLFGSVARGTSTESSDVDLLVTMKPGSSLLDIIAIKQDLEDLLGRKVDVVTENSISPYIKDEILKEAVNL
ncbi:MAG: nucleotidyltransferase family protein [Verrucomicrobia bacterium]|nr:nucleotidyltransferase family protein [Verrucomicrobiota bacterium]MBS0636489.1 nucleotidyltransferase family protein [Verrucomicrobiota bacterium]